MKKIRIEEIYHCSADHYLDKLLDAEHRGERETKGCGALSFKILSSGWDGDEYSQLAEIVEQVAAPKPVRKIFGETSRIEETSQYTRGGNTARISYRPNIMGDRVRMEGKLVCTPIDEGSCRVVIDLEITAKVFGIGGIVERLVAKELPNRQVKDRAYFNAHQKPE